MRQSNLNTILKKDVFLYRTKKVRSWKITCIEKWENERNSLREAQGRQSFITVVAEVAKFNNILT